VPKNFYFEVESIGNLEPDAIIQQGIKVMQQKLAAVIQDLTEGDGRANNGGYDAPQSPDTGMNGGGWQDPGYATPYGNTASAWSGGAGAATPYGATPYGQNHGNGWA
jgi:DNA-directed RNA polymerase II subunit RPB3